MKWNWQNTHWPHFLYDETQLTEYETIFIKESGLFLGALKHVSDADKDELKVEIIGNEALQTSKIEGVLLERQSLQSSLKRHFGLSHDGKKIPQAEQGISDMMVQVYKSSLDILSEKMLFDWHKSLTLGRKDLTDMGCYRTHADPMQVVSGGFAHKKVHFQAPPSVEVPKEMKQFIHWFNVTSPKGTSPLKPLVRTGICHIYFESIHPFEDGNGRIGRALCEKSLSQNLGHPTLISLAHTIEKHRKSYYENLEKNNKELEITSWLVYFSKTVVEAQRYTQQLIDFIIFKTKLFNTYKDALNERQKKVLERIFREGPEGFIGDLSAEKYIAISKTSRATATRDLGDLVSKSILIQTGKYKTTRYRLNFNAHSKKPLG